MGYPGSAMDDGSPRARLRIGAPIWSCPHWVGEVYPPGTGARAYLRRYAEVFDAVEGNATFYAAPSTATVMRWRDETPPTFRFCCKLPRTITHDRMLVGTDELLQSFVATIELLGDRLGPIMIQLPPAFGPARLPALEAFLERLPRAVPWALDPRHRGLFVGDAGRRLDDRLRALAIDRVVFDTTVLHASRDRDPAVVEAQRRKPALPDRDSDTGPRPIVRVVVANDVDAAAPAFDRWAARVAAWLAAGRSAHVFVHTPDDRFAPRMCVAFHDRLAARVPVGAAPRLGAHVDATVPSGASPRQISLFDRSPDAGGDHDGHG